jgi:hypothetical protein
VKLPAHRAGPFDRALGPEHFEGLPGNDLLFHIVPLDPNEFLEMGKVVDQEMKGGWSGIVLKGFAEG